MSKTIVGIFTSYDSAENAAKQVKAAGLRTDDISIIAKENYTRQEDNANTFTNHSATNDNISDGTVTGGVLGGLAGLLLGMGTVVIPGLGVIAAAGPIAGLLSGALTGGIIGSLADLGIPEEASRRYESDIKQGKILWSMRTEEENVDKISGILRNSGAQNIEVH